MNTFLFWQFRISTAFLLLFAAFFLPLRYGKKKTSAVLLLGYLVTGIMDYYCFIVVKNGQVPLAITFAEILAIQVIPLIISKYRDFRSVFIGITASAYVLGGNVLGSTLYIADFGNAVCMAASVLIHGILLGVFVIWLRKGILQILSNKSVNWASLCLIPSLFYAAIYAICSWPADIYETPKNLLGAYFILCLLVTTYVLIIQLFIRIQRDGELRRSMEYLEDYAKRLKYEADILQEREHGASVLRHDLRHYIIMSENYLETGDLESLRSLIKTLDSHMERLKPVRYCENLSANAVIDHCVREAKKQQVEFRVNTELPQKLSVNEFEFATVLSNLLENALHAAGEAEEGKREMWISSKVIKGKMMIEIGNTYGKRPEMSADTGFPVSTGESGHGYGLQSVRAFVKKNNALIDYSIEDSEVFVRFLVNI